MSPNTLMNGKKRVIKYGKSLCIAETNKILVALYDLSTDDIEFLYKS